MEASAAPRPALPRRGGLVSPRLLRVASDDKLVALVRQGSQPAFEVVYDRHHRGILSFCRHMLGSREEAEDALQHTFMAAYRDLLGSDKPIQLRAWLYAIARNRCLTVLRSRREKPVDELEDIPTEGLASEVQRRHDLQDLLRDLAALPADQREALVLAEIGDLPHDEIAAVIGCPKEKVKALVFQARTSLHSSREARETSCEEIREMLSSLRGGSLRRTALRRHLRECAGCREFQAEVKRQRAAMTVLLPVVPSLGLKDSVLAAAFSSHGVAAGTAATAGAGAAALAGSGAAAGGGSAFVAKALVVAVAVGGGAAGVKAASSGDGSVAPSKAPSTTAAPAADHAPSPTPTASAPAAAALVPAAASEKAERKKAKRHHKTDRGKALAKTRGKGRKHGLLGTQPGRTKSATKAQPQGTGGQRLARQQAAVQKRAAAKRTATTRAKQRRAVRKARRHAAPVRRIKKQTTSQPPPQQEPAATPTPEPTPESGPSLLPGVGGGKAVGIGKGK
jgi:RNA polymerase sigma factor (sigma-70 family)